MVDKNSKIRESILETKARRKDQECAVFKIKIQESKLKPKQAEALKMLFVEGKWLKNDCLNFGEENNIFEYQIPKVVSIKTKDGEFVKRNLEFIGSQMKQSCIAELFSNIKTLSTLKKKGKKVGRLKFCSEVKSINLVQYGTTYNFKNQKKIKIQNVPGYLTVNGTNQFWNKGYEFANAKLLNTPNGYYVAVTCFKKKETKNPDSLLAPIGVDMGIFTHLTLSDGRKINSTVEETERLKKLQRSLKRKQKGSNSRKKTIVKIRQEHQKMTNRKNDATNKIVHELLKHSQIFIQDENLKGWKVRFGKTIQHSILGRVKARLIKSPQVVVLGRFEPTTKLCTNCGVLHDMKLSDRMFVCECGVSMDRDIHAAQNMIVIGQNYIKPIRQELADFKPVEIQTSASRKLKVSSKSMKQEAYTTSVCK